MEQQKVLSLRRNKMALEKTVFACGMTYLTGVITATVNMGSPEGSVGNYVGKAAIITALVGAATGVTLEFVGDYLDKRKIKQQEREEAKYYKIARGDNK